MKINFTSTKVFLAALLFYAIGFICYMKASEIYYQNLELLNNSVFRNSTLYSSPDFNWWHYAAFANICVAVGATAAAFLLRKSGI